MHNLCIDPVIVTTPPQDANRDEVYAWLQHLQIWLSEALNSPYTWLHFIAATYTLGAERRFPDPDILLTWQRKHNFGDINLSRLNKDINTFFRDETRDLHHQLEQREYVVVTDSVHINPELFVLRWHKSIQAEMKQIFITACACKHDKNSFAQNLRILTLKLPENVQEIEISATITEALPESILTEGQNIAQSFPLLFTPDDLLPLINVMELWLQGVEGLQYAIEQHFKKNWQKIVDAPMPFCLGERFIASIQEKGLDTNEIVLTKIVRIAAAVIADQARAIKGCELHHLRKGDAGDSPQRTRDSDGAKAWR